MSTTDSRHATNDAGESGPFDSSRDGANSQQAIDVSSPSRHAPAGPIVQPPMLQPISTVEAAAALNSDQSNMLASPTGYPADRLNLPQQQGQAPPDTQLTLALLLWDPVLQTLAAGLDDVESTRIAQANRYRILTTDAEDSDGEVRGFGLAKDHPAVAALEAQLHTLEFLDKQMTKALSKQLRAHPLYPWIKGQHGLGDKTVARLLAAVRDPYWNDLHDRPRTVGELFAFCGVAGPGLRRQRGKLLNWSPDARKRLWIIATGTVKVGGPYREVYDAGRVRYADKTHTAPCVQCGGKGSPAAEGTEWRDGHKHAGAVRLVMREVLRDLWMQSRDLYASKEMAA